VIGTADHVIPVASQTFMAQRAGHGHVRRREVRRGAEVMDRLFS
jgi:hypothetical protein